MRLLQPKHTLAVVRALLEGPQRFQALLRHSAVPSATTLGRRLRELQAAGVVEGRGGSYRLTGAGENLRLLFGALEGFGARFPACDPSDILAALGRRSALPVMGALVGRELGFNDLHRAARTPRATTLARRLEDLGGLGLLRREPRAGAGRPVYAQSAAGEEFGAVMAQIVAWGEATFAAGGAPPPAPACRG